MVGLMLSIFFGYVGGYRFYKKQYVMGIIYIFTLGILGFGWIFDKSFVKSLRENYCGFDLRYFETLETKTNGTYFVGGNSRTLAFRETVKYLSEHTGIKYSHTKRI